MRTTSKTANPFEAFAQKNGKQLIKLHQTIHEVHNDLPDEQLIMEFEHMILLAWCPEGVYSGDEIYDRLSKMLGIRRLLNSMLEYHLQTEENIEEILLP